jgi:hypothetical protein
MAGFAKTIPIENLALVSIWANTKELCREKL